MENIKIEEDLFPLNFKEGIHFEDGILQKNKGIISDSYVCVRPSNKRNVPKVSVENLSDRLLVNNYGHGGIGWSTLWGSVQKSIELLETKVTNEELSKGKRIVVIGAGCVGCATVLSLIEKGIKPENIEIFTKQMGDTTSHRSGAILSTASILDGIDPALEEMFDDININTFTTWDLIEKGEKFTKLQDGIQKVKAYFGAEKEWGTIETVSGLDVFVENKLIPPPELVKVKFGNRLNLMRKYDCFYFNPYKLMKAFYDYILQDYKIKINFAEIKCFDEIDKSFDVIFNCTGVSNGTSLKYDSDIVPLAGHIITLKHQDIGKFNYVMYSHYIHEEDIGKYTYETASLFYLMLKTDDKSYTGLLGGSFVPNYYGGDNEIDQREYKGILKRTLEIFGEDYKKYFG
jgi:hypothetical protein